MNQNTAITPAEDRELLRDYVERASATAFDELVRRHLDHVFSAALRRVNGDHALAKDVMQTVFIDFARKAGRIAPDVPPGGWLHRHTGFVASKMIDRERRCRGREKEAAAMNMIAHSSSNDPEWESTAPLLDAAMDALPASDRDAIVLRFFERKDFRSVGVALGMSDDSAQKKVSRAIEKLRKVLNRRGVASTGGALAGVLAARSVEAAPPSLAGEISAQSLAGAATSGGTLAGALAGLDTAARIKAAVAAVGLATAAAFAGPLFMPPRIPLPRVDTAPGPRGRAAEIVEREGPRAQAPTPRPVSQPMDVAALVAAAAAEWRGGWETIAGTAKALGFLSRITPGQMPRALAITAELKDEPAQALLSRYLLSHWAESEPREAMAWARGDESNVHQVDVVQGILEAWAGRNPEAVMGWKRSATKVRPVRVSESVLGTVFRTMAKDDPEKALSRLVELPSPNHRGLALRGILDTVQTDADREKITAMIAGIREDDIRIQARRAVIEKWARRDAPAAAAFVEMAEPAWERTRLMDSLGLTWLQSDPASAAQWWVAHAPGPDTLVKIINVWAQQDPNAAGAWLGRRAPGPSSDAARMTFARQVADLDPESALRWAETVSEAGMREGTIDHVFANWHLRNPAQARAFLRQSGWPVERVARLQNTSNPK